MTKPTAEQTAWVFEQLITCAEKGGTFRYLIYDLMGYEPTDYQKLYLAGGMTIYNAIGPDHCGLYKSRVEEFEAELADWKASHKRAIESPCPDEQHCACVPFLQQELAILREENARLKAIVDRARFGSCGH